MFTSRTVAVDATVPTATVTSPASGGANDLGAVVKPAFTCADVGSGVVSCTGPATVDTSSTGAHTYAVTVTDVVGNRATVTVRAAFTCTVANGAVVDTSVGAHVLRDAVDGAGNATTRAVTYIVRGQTFEGFFSPIVAAPAVNDASAGNTVPFKFRLDGRGPLPRSTGDGRHVGGSLWT